jgi:tetratricopeptide (TPR) repeat protein
LAGPNHCRSIPAVVSLDAALSAVRKFTRSRWLDLVRRDQCERWRGGGRVSAERYFDLLPEMLADREEMLVLICGEMQLRRELGDGFDLDEYQCRFPDFAPEIELQFDADTVLPSGRELLGTEAVSDDIASLHLSGYEILKELGRGASGIVYLARQLSTDRRVAVKAIPLSISDRQRFTRQHQEAAILSQLQHPHVVQIYDLVEQDGMLCLIIEYVAGPTLVAFAAGNPQPPIEAARLVRTLAAAIHVVHDAGIFHRDLKPSNILLTSLGDPKITDFGLAKLVSSDNLLTTDNCLLGTPCYMPPEQATIGGHTAGREGDVYSLGAILYELLTGRPPFVGVTILDTLSLIRDRDPVPCRTLQPQTPRDLETICLKCLEKAPRQRYATAAALAADLDRFLQGLAIEARPRSWKETAIRWCRRRPAVAILAVCLAVAIIGGFCGVLWQWNQAESARHEADNRTTEIQQGVKNSGEAAALEDRARVFRGWRRWDDAINALDEAVALCPERGSAWEERGELYADLGLWDLALADRRRAFERNEPAVSARWWSYGTLLAQAGDLNRYRRLNARMRKRFQGYGDRVAADVARTDCLIDGADDDYALAAERLRADQGRSHDPFYFYAWGLTCYRAGNATQAVDCCLESLKDGENWSERSLNFPVLAMAYAKLGKLDLAQSNLESASQERDRWIQDLYASGEKNWTRHKGVSGEWQLSPFSWLEFNLLYKEARTLLKQPMLPEDPRLIVLRARALAIICRFDEADAEYQKAIGLAPNVNLIQMERHRCAAYRNIDRRDFARAAIEFAEAARFDPADIKLWAYTAQAHLAAGNIAAYRQACREMHQLHRGTNDPDTAEQIVWTCANRADSLPNMTDLLPLASLAVEAFPYTARTKGAALVRAGRYEEALQSFDDSSRYNASQPADMCFQAIACFHLGRLEQSRRHIDDALRWIAQADQQKLPSVELTQPAWAHYGWDEHLAALRLLAEAKALTEHGPRATKSSTEGRPAGGG